MILANVGDDDIRAGGGESPGNAEAHTACATGDECDLAADILH